MKSMLILVLFGICTVTLNAANAADLTPQQLADADKVAHAYVEAWLAGDYDKAVVLSDFSHAIGTSTRVSRQATQAIKFSALTTEYKRTPGTKTVWWLGLVQVGETWKVCYTNPLEANRPNHLASYVKRKAAVREDALPSFERNMKDYKKMVEDFRAKQAAGAK